MGKTSRLPSMSSTVSEAKKKNYVASPIIYKFSSKDKKDDKIPTNKKKIQ